jgi:hypothetical protein
MDELLGSERVQRDVLAADNSEDEEPSEA